MGSTIVEQLETFGPGRCERLDYEQASQYTRRLAKEHYENFSVVSWFLPKRLRDDFRHVYAFCRWADDLGDEVGDPARSVELLDWWRREIDACYADEPRHPVFVALHHTIRRHDIPRKPFDDLIDAFIQDQTVTRYDTWEQVLDYCTRSADPVGRLVLYVCGYRDEPRQRLSDATCTALQLANFWQDVHRDIIERDRVYIPSDVASRHGLDIATMVAAVKAAHHNPMGHPGNGRQSQNHTRLACCGSGVTSAGLRAVHDGATATIKELVGRTWPLFTRGRALWPTVSRDIRVDLQLFTAGGESILRMIQRQGYDTLSRRPSLSRGAKLALMLRAAVGKMAGSFVGRPQWEAS